MLTNRQIHRDMDSDTHIGRQEEQKIHYVMQEGTAQGLCYYKFIGTIGQHVLLASLKDLQHHGLKLVNLSSCFERLRTLVSDDMITLQMFYLVCFNE